MAEGGNCQPPQISYAPSGALASASTLHPRQKEIPRPVAPRPGAGRDAFLELAAGVAETAQDLKKIERPGCRAGFTTGKPVLPPGAFVLSLEDGDNDPAL